MILNNDSYLQHDLYHNRVWNKDLNDLMVDDNHWEVNEENRMNDRIEFHIDNQLEDEMDEIQSKDNDEYSKKESDFFL
jgi:hypothetical protein